MKRNKHLQWLLKSLIAVSGFLLALIIIFTFISVFQVYKDEVNGKVAGVKRIPKGFDIRLEDGTSDFWWNTYPNDTPNVFGQHVLREGDTVEKVAGEFSYIVNGSRKNTFFDIVRNEPLFIPAMFLFPLFAVSTLVYLYIGRKRVSLD